VANEDVFLIATLQTEHSMNRRILLSALLLIVGYAAAQEHPTITAQPNTLYVGADGKFESAPDTALIQFNISAQEDNPKAAYDRASRNAEQIRQILRSNGVEPSAAQIGFFSIAPVYDWRSAKRKVVGYRVNTAVSLKLRDFSKIGPIVQQLSDTDITENQSINYTLENIDTAKAKAVEDAYRHARANAEAIARVGGRTVEALAYASVDTNEQNRIVPMRMPVTMMRAQAEAAPAPTAEFSPQDVTVTAHVNAVFTMK
jgi:uncharacterized protein YggE